jgi:aspartate/methionine/tyrosine aminotransferase
VVTGYTSRNADRFGESVIRDMTRLFALHHPLDGVNLSQGFPDFPAPLAVKEAACRAIMDDCNQYAVTSGEAALCEALAQTTGRAWGRNVDAEREVTVCCGATEAMAAAMAATIDPGDEVIVFSPCYENYAPNARLAGATVRYVALRPPDWAFDPAELAAAFGPRTKGIVVNTPHNPTGKVFLRVELELIAAHCREHDALVFTDEVYEHLVYEGEHFSMAALPGMAERTITVNGFSKTFSVTGWRLGYTIAAPAITQAIRKLHDILTCGAPRPLQMAATAALSLGNDYHAAMLSEYRARRDYLLGALAGAGFRPHAPAGAFYIMAGIEHFGYADDVAFAHHLVRDVGLAVVPGSSFFAEPENGRQFVRFAFCKRLSTLVRAAALLARIEAPAGIS